MSFWKILSRSASDVTTKLGGKLQPKPATQDQSLPLGGRIGGYIQVNDSAILVASTLGSIVVPPETGEVRIIAISRIRLEGWPEKLGLYRYYVATGDGGDKERYIQVMTENGVFKEAVYFTSLTRLYPQNPEMIKYYSGELGDDGIGAGEWVFNRDDLKGLLTEEQFKSLSIEINEIAWQRAIGDGNHVSPVKGVENRIDDAVGDMGIHQQVWCMPHTRALQGGLVEHLFISLEVMDSHDGKREQDVHVDFMVGVPLSADDFRII